MRVRRHLVAWVVAGATFLAVTGALVLVTMGSALIPARRASPVHPMEAPRHE